MRYYVRLFVFFMGLLTMAQEKGPTISLELHEVPLREALEKVAEVSGFDFFYIDEWLEASTISGSYRNAPVDQILEDILKNTVLNFYITDSQQVVLTRNSIIYDHLPADFFGRQEEQTVAQVRNAPILLNEVRSLSGPSIETIRIGKERSNTTAARFTLSGYATNTVTGRPISEMAIVVRDRNIGTATDENGYYELQLPLGMNILESSALGIEPTVKKVIIYNNGTYDYDLGESLEMLDEVVLEGDRNRNVEQAVTGITTFEVENIKNIPLVLGERDILKAALTLPGISTAGEGSAGYNVRGGATDQNLILLDDAVIYNPAHFFGIFSALNPFTTGTVNIYKGSIPADYGGRLSSVFDITTKDANTQKFSGEASIGPVTSNLMLESPIIKDKSALIVGGRATYSDWILQSLDEESLQNSKASFYDVVAKYNHAINANNDIKATAYFSKDIFSITSDSVFDYSNRLFSLKWNHKFNDGNTGSLLLSNSEYRFNIDYDGDSNNDFDLGYKVNETEFKLKLKKILNDSHTLDYGLSGKLYLVSPGNIDPQGSESQVSPLSIPQEKGLESALFISDSYNISDKWSVNAGIRYSLYAALGRSEQRIYEEGVPKNDGSFQETREYGDNEVIETYGGPEFRLSTRYFIAPELSIKAGYNNTYQYIHTLSSNTTVSPTDTWKLSDINIKPQEARQYSLGLFKNIDGNTYELSLEGYYKQSKNILDYKVGAQLLLNEEIETEVLQGDGKAYGVELLIKKNEGRLNGWLGYTYSRAFIKLDSEFPEETVNNGAYFPANYDKPHDISLVANYKFTKRMSVSANFVYQTGRPVTYPIGQYEYENAQYVYYSDRNRYRIPDYYRLDLSFNMEGNHKIKKFAHSFWNFSIYNVLGRNNPYSVFFVTDNGSLKAYQSSIFSIPVPTLTYNFKF
mgnify:CR=1 FL=1|tara:strand:- start:83060 stop:85813 length:2754 start_codon:yes stop_codon:yes gene_type:complete